MDNWFAVITLVFGGLIGYGGSVLQWWLSGKSEGEKQRRQWQKEYRDENIRPVRGFLDWAVQQNNRLGSYSTEQHIITVLEKLERREEADSIRKHLSGNRHRAFNNLLDITEEKVNPALAYLGDAQLKEHVKNVYISLMLRLLEIDSSPEVAEVQRTRPGFEEALPASYQRIRELLTEHM